jgi:antitoxin MazE
MNITQSLQKWGNSTGIRIPKKVIEKARLQQNEPLEISVKGRSVILTPIKKNQIITLDNLLRNVKPDDIKGEYDWGSPVGKELW